MDSFLTKDEAPKTENGLEVIVKEQAETPADNTKTVESSQTPEPETETVAQTEPETVHTIGATDKGAPVMDYFEQGAPEDVTPLERIAQERTKLADEEYEVLCATYEQREKDLLDKQTSERAALKEIQEKGVLTVNGVEFSNRKLSEQHAIENVIKILQDVTGKRNSDLLGAMKKEQGYLKLQKIKDDRKRAARLPK
jgi:hypothetical protein